MFKKLTVKQKSIRKIKHQKDTKALTALDIDDKIISPPDGLTNIEARKRLYRFGPNEIEEKQSNPLVKLLTYFWGPIPWMIEIAMILSAIVRH
jgi:H+-transporting ATPase